MKKILVGLFFIFSFEAFAWQKAFKNEIKKIDQDFEGEVGVVMKNLNDGTLLTYNADKLWYLSSTVKVMVAISLMKEVEKGNISLDQKITLTKDHFVDGAGAVVWSEPGTVFTVSQLLKYMLRESDNTAADMLIGLIGIDKLNQNIRKWMPDSGTFTSLLDVRKHAYSELSPKAKNLTNMDFILIKNSPVEERHKEFARKINVKPEDLQAENMEDAFEKYYEKNYNSARLQDFVTLLEKLERGELLSQKHTGIILDHMEHMKTGDHRIKAGLPDGITFRQKTGTQIHRACNVGLLKKNTDETSTYAIAVCITKPDEDINSDEVFKKIGEKVGTIFFR